MKTAILALILASGSALAGPRESVTFHDVLNDGMRNWYQNEFRDCLFHGDYMASRVHIAGTIRALVPGQTLLETQIAVGAPDWNIVWVYPFGDLTNEYDTFTLVDNVFDLESPVRADGPWAFQFFETADDPTGPDAIWDTVTITLDDAPPPSDIWYEYLKVDTGETLATAQSTLGSGPLNQIRGFGSASDADLYRINITDAAQFTAYAQLIRYFGDGAQLCLFNTDGYGIMAIDARTPVLPVLNNASHNLRNGEVLLGIASSDRYPVDVLGQRIFPETLNTLVTASGPGAVNPLDHWEGTGATIQYHITLTGVGYAGLKNTCTADFDQDGDAATDADIQAFFSCLGGDCCPNCTADFNDDGDSATDADIEAFFRVLGGGPC